MRSRSYWWLLFLIPVIPLWRALFMGDVIGPFDQLRTMAPWNAAAPRQPWDVLQADGTLQFFVWRSLVFDAWSHLHVPFWNPYELAGTPLLANSQSGALYPLHIVLGLLHVPVGLAITLLAWFHLSWAGLGSYRLARRLGADEAGGLLAGVSFSLSPFLVSWTALASVITTVCWIPWALSFLHDVLDRESPDGQLKVPLRSAAVLAGCVAMMVLAGHLQFVAYGFIALTIYGVVKLIESRAWTRIGYAVLGAAVGLMIALPQLLPVLNYSQFSHRRNTPSEDGYAGYSASAIQTWELGNLVNPMGLGDPRTEMSQMPISTYWPSIVKRGANFAESAVAPGAVCLAALCVFIATRRRMKGAMPLALVGLVALLMATGTGVNRLLYFGFPGWSSTGSPGRAIVLFVMAVGVLGGVAVKYLTPDTRAIPNPRPIQFGAVVFVFLTAMTMALGMKGAVPPEGLDKEIFQQVVGAASANGTLLTLFIAIIAIQPVIFVSFRRTLRGGTLSSMIFPAAALVIALLSGTANLIMSGKPLDVPRADTTERIAILNDPWDLMMAAPAALPPNLAALGGWHELGGYDSLLHRDTAGLIKDVDGEDPFPQANGNMVFVKPRFDPAKLADAGVTQIWRRGSQPGNLPPIGTIQRDVLPGPSRASVENDPKRAHITSEGWNELTVNATGPGHLVVRDRLMPGWTATVDGKATDIAGSMWRELELPTGDHTVQFSYVAPGYATGLAIGLVGFLVWIALLLISRRPPRGESFTDPILVIDAEAVPA